MRKCWPPGWSRLAAPSGTAASGESLCLQKHVVSSSCSAYHLTVLVWFTYVNHTYVGVWEDLTDQWSRALGWSCLAGPSGTAASGASPCLQEILVLRLLLSRSPCCSCVMDTCVGSSGAFGWSVVQTLGWSCLAAISGAAAGDETRFQSLWLQGNSCLHAHECASTPLWPRTLTRLPSWCSVRP